VADGARLEEGLDDGYAERAGPAGHDDIAASKIHHGFLAG
jgi:hypothetical protein